MVAACACIAIVQNSSTPITAKPFRLLPLSILASDAPSLRTSSELGPPKTEGKSNLERFNKCCCHRPMAGSAPRCFLHRGKRPTDPWPQRLPSHLNTLETAADGANRMHDQAVNQRSVSALGPCAGKPSRWDITGKLRNLNNPAYAHNNDGGRAR